MKSKPHTDPRLPPFYWEEVILLVLSALAVAGIWWLFRDLVFPKQTPPAQIQPNLPPIAITIHIRAVAGERIVIDVREYSYDPEGETPRILGLGSPRFGVVERIDDYRFRYSAPLRNREKENSRAEKAKASGSNAKDQEQDQGKENSQAEKAKASGGNAEKAGVKSKQPVCLVS